MEISRERHRIGFILATIHAGSALKLWHKLAARAERDSGAFFVFPGGKLEKKTGDENLRNDIYKLVNSSNIDGLISWASSISGSVSVKEIEEFHGQFQSIPFVTIGQKVSGHPCAEFDAYIGMKELVQHFIKVHGVKKIAFLRGPETHTSAENRFRGYKDALVEAGLYSSESEKLISSPLSWYDGEKGAAQLFEERSLVPGRDFEALVSASDLMTFAATNYFKQKGFRIPKDFLVGGFNDTEESRISIPSFSTVHMPHAELGVGAYESISSMLQGMLGVSDINLPAYPVIRESCGCIHTKALYSMESKIKIRTKEQFNEEICKILRLDSAEANLAPMIDVLFENERAKFYELLTQRLTAYFQNDGELIKLFSIIALFRNITCLSQEYIEKIIRHVSILIPRVQERVLIEQQYKSERINGVISSLKNDMLSVFERNKLIGILHNHLKKIGINTLAIVLHEDETYSNYIAGFNSAGEVRNEEVKFPRGELVPDRFSADFDKGVFIVQPLFVEDHSYGYVICNYSGCHGIIYEDLRSSLSSALQNIFLFESTNEAKRIAEQAEFAKTEFFANVGSDLCDPLKDISAKLKQMEANVEKGILEK
ncbi:LacI family DNA-binding transcriptional regulator, partial [Treponema sp.]|uniref:LacI family DNA-binding transcriptional regulator n=1 Tax=Treponema sp. TaxID=166 RepID=UPI00388D19DE